MELRLLDKGLKLSVEKLNADSTSAFEPHMTGYYYDAPNNFLLTFTCDELYERYQDKKCFASYRISFTKGTVTYSFDGKINSVKATMFKENLITFNITTPLHMNNIRNNPRADVTLPVKLYSITPGTNSQMKDFVCGGITNDVSTGGMCFLSDFLIRPEEHGNRFISEFILAKSPPFFVVSDLKFHGGNVKTLVYKHTYGFAYDFTENPDQKSNLMLAILKHQIG